MANVADHRDDAEGTSLAAMLDPVALEARLADARARRAVVLAARTPPPEPAPRRAAPRRFRPGWRSVTAALLVAGVAAAAAGGLLAPRLRLPLVPPEIALSAAVPALPGGIPPAPAPGAAVRLAATPLPPELAAPVLVADALPPQPLRPEPRPPRPAVAASRTRAAGVPLADAAPVLARAVATAIPRMIGRATEGGTLAYPLAVVRRDAGAGRVPKVLREAEGLVRQLARAGRSALNSGTVRKASVAGIVPRAAAPAPSRAAPPGKVPSAKGATRQSPGGAPGRRASRDDGGKGGSTRRGGGRSGSRGDDEGKGTNAKGHGAGKGGKEDRAGNGSKDRGNDGSKAHGGGKGGKQDRAGNGSKGPAGKDGTKDRGNDGSKAHGGGKGGSKGHGGGEGKGKGGRR